MASKGGAGAGQPGQGEQVERAGQVEGDGAPQIVPLRRETLARLRAEYEVAAAAQAAWQGSVALLACELGVDPAHYVVDLSVGFVATSPGQEG
jgi:hypothetical protein